MSGHFKCIGDIDFGQYDATNYNDSSSKDLFNRIFLHDSKFR